MPVTEGVVEHILGNIICVLSESNMRRLMPLSCLCILNIELKLGHGYRRLHNDWKQRGKQETAHTVNLHETTKCCVCISVCVCIKIKE